MNGPKQTTEFVVRHGLQENPQTWLLLWNGPQIGPQGCQSLEDILSNSTYHNAKMRAQNCTGYFAVEAKSLPPVTRPSASFLQGRTRGFAHIPTPKKKPRPRFLPRDWFMLDFTLPVIAWLFLTSHLSRLNLLLLSLRNGLLLRSRHLSLQPSHHESVLGSLCVNRKTGRPEPIDES